MQPRVLLLLLLASWHTHGVAKWVLAGLGHCTVPLEILQNKNLAGCLRSCEVAGKRCSYVSFLDDALIRSKETSPDLDDLLAMRPSPKAGQGVNGVAVAGVLGGAFSGGTLCLHFAHCGALKSTLSGSATFLREEHVNHVDGEREWPEDDILVTISTSRSMSSRRTWQLRKQLCVSAELGEAVAALKDICADFWTVKYVSGPVMESHMVDSTAAVRVTIQRGKHFLCSRSEPGGTISPASPASTAVWLSESCDGLDALGTWDVVRAGESQEVVDSEPCVWLRAAHNGNFTQGQYLSVSEDHGDHRLTFLPWSTDMSASCWNFGYEQTWMQHNFVGREDFEIHAATDTSCKPTHATQVTQCQGGHGARRGAVPHIWLMASPKYTETMQRLLSTFQRAQEPVRVSVRWVPDFKDTKRSGFILTGQAPRARRVYAFNYLKLLFLFEAYLDGVQSEDDMVVVMDLDVQVRRGWTRTLEKCMEDAEICFLQQAAFGDRWQQANSGVLVFKPTAAVGAFYHALGARLQGQEILVRLLPSMDAVAFEQLLLNYMLQQIRGLVNFTEAEGEMSNLTTVRWGIYSPLVAYAGMFLTAAVLTDTVHHATASNADLRSKLRLMDGAELFVADLREFCPLDPSGFLEIIGPLLEFCYYFIGVDPHFGPLLDHYRVHRGFSETDNLVVLDHLQTRARGRKAWIQAVISFNEGGYKYYKAKRRNSSAVLGDALLHPAF